MHFFCCFLMILLPTSIETGCSLKKNFVSVTITVPVLNIWWFIEVKTSASISPVSSNSLFWWLLLAWLKIIMLLEFSCFRMWEKTECKKKHELNRMWENTWTDKARKWRDKEFTEKANYNCKIWPQLHHK